MEHLKRAATLLREEAPLLVLGLPGTGKSTFVRQLISPEIRTRLGLDQGYRMVLLDGQELVHSSLEHIWGAIVTALNRSRSSHSVVCEAKDAQAISYEHLKDALRSFRDYKLILILDHWPDLPTESKGSIYERLFHLPPKYCPTLVVVPNACILERGDQFVPIDLTLSPEQAKQFLVEALSQLDLCTAIEQGFFHEIVDWVGGNLYLLDRACYWTIKLHENPSDVTERWVSGKIRQSSFREWRLAEEMICQLAKGVSLEKCSGVNGEPSHPAFRRIVYEMCLLDAQELFARWLKTLSEREQIILLALDELQHLTPRWQSEMERLSTRGFVQRLEHRYLIRPKMFDDYISRKLTICSGGSFRFDLKNIQTIYVNDTPCKLSPEQACVFFRLFLQRNDIVPYSELYADLYTPYDHIIGVRMHELDQLSMIAVDLELDELRKTLKVDKEIERVPPDDDAPLRGYRLVVSTEDRDSRQFLWMDDMTA